jgi:outer membrane protein assembly factor BamB
VYDDNNGALAATVKLGGNDTEAQNNEVHYKNTAAWGPYLFWGCLGKGVMRFNTGLIDFTVPPGTEQVILPELAWSDAEKNIPFTNMIAEDGVIYFLTLNRGYHNRTNHAHLVALDAETKTAKWKKSLAHIDGSRDTSLVLNGERLYVIDFAPSCYNKATGAPVFETDLEDVRAGTQVFTDAGPYLRGITVYNDKLYYTGGMHSLTSSMDPEADPARIKNITCIDSDTGFPVWGDLVPGGLSIFTNVLVQSGKAYVQTDKGLRVYNAATGALIGVDKSVKSFGNYHNLLYNGMVIYPNKESFPYGPYTILTAIKAE